MENKPWPNECYPPTSPYEKFQQDEKEEKLRRLSYNSRPLPLAQVANLRVPNTNDWSSEQKSIWEKKDSVEVERYYLNTHSKIKEMKKSARGKPTCLIRKKKEWRNGLANILVNTVDGWKPIHRLPSPSPIVPPSVRTVAGMPTNKTGAMKPRGSLPAVMEAQPSWNISSDEEPEDKLLL